MRTVSLLFVLSCLTWGISQAGAQSAASQLPNGTFETGTQSQGAYQPQGWTAPEKNGVAASSGYRSKRSLGVTGNGEDDAAWISDPVAVTPGDLFEFSFWGSAEKGTKGGSALSGPTFCNRDYRLGETWKQKAFVFRVPENQTQAHFRVGQWRTQGKLFFDDVNLVPVQPVYARRGVLPLGEGERVENDRYEARHVLSSKGSNSCRFLDSTTTEFNSNRWVFGPKAAVIYRHELPGNLFLQGVVTITINHYTSGGCRVLVRGNQDRWTELGTVAQANTVSWKLPPAALPASNLEIQLEAVADEKGRCDFQVDQYGFEANLQTPVPAMEGSTEYVRILKRDPRLGVTLYDLGDPKPRIPSEIQITLLNSFGKKRNLLLNIEVAGEKSQDRIERKLTLKPQEMKTLSVPYTVSETGEVLFTLRVTDQSGIFYYEGQIQKIVSYLHAADYGDLVEEDPNAAIWWSPAMYKISPSRPAPSRGKKEVSLSAARGEFEPVQVVLRPKKALKNLKVTAGDFFGPAGFHIAGDQVSIRQVEYVHITHPSDALGAAGDWPDPLPPVEESLNLESNRNYPFWITMFAPREAPAGIYVGHIVFTAEGWEGQAPVRLRIYDFEIPQRFRLRTAFGFDVGLVLQYHHLSMDDEWKKVIDLYYQDFRDHRISPYNPTELYPIQTELSKHYTFHFDEFDQAAKRYLDEFGFTSLHLPLLGMGGGTFHDRRKGKIGNYEQGTPEHERLFHEYASTVENHLREKGWLEKAFVYWFDEPEPRDYEFVKEGMDLIHRNAPGLKRFLTEQPEKELAGWVDIWCPILDAFEPEAARQRQQDGEEIWWYICTGPKEPYPGLFIDHPAVDLRMWMWMTQKYGVQGALVWQSNYWTSNLAYPEPNVQDPWNDPMSYVSGYGNLVGHREYWGNGDGRFLYPPRRWKDGGKLLCGPVDSIRWEMLREGIEDYEYFAMLQDWVHQKKLSVEFTNKAKELLAIPKEIIASRTEYTKDPRLLYNRREAIAELLERAARK